MAIQPYRPNLSRVKIRTWKDQEFHLWHPTTTLSTAGQTPKHYGEISEQIKAELESIHDTQQDEQPDLKWVHIPYNSTVVCQDVLKLLLAEQQYETLLGPASPYWKNREVEPTMTRKHMFKRFMRPGGFRFDASGKVVEDDPDNRDDTSNEISPDPQPSKSSKDGRGNTGSNPHNAAESLKQDDKEEDSMVLYMPYLHWANVRDHQTASWPPVEDVSVHPRRTLDEAGFTYHNPQDLERRNSDQVVTRFLRKFSHNKDEVTLMMVDQLWIWAFPKKNILVTSFASKEYCCQYQEHVTCPNLDLECLSIEQAMSRWRHAKGSPRKAQRMASHIIFKCYSIFFPDHHSDQKRTPDLQYLDYFRVTLARKRAKSTDLFHRLVNNVKHEKASNMSSRARTTPTSPSMYLSDSPISNRLPASRKRIMRDIGIGSDIRTIYKVRDVNEELRIMSDIIEQQRNALRGFQHRREKIWKKHLSSYRGTLDKLQLEAQSIQELLSTGLSIKRTELSVRQNQVVITFTIVTIIFLPLGFISSIFGMNASELTGDSPPTIGIIFAYMLPIAVAMIVPALLVPFYPWVRDPVLHAWERVWEYIASGNNSSATEPMI